MRRALPCTKNRGDGRYILAAMSLMAIYKAGEDPVAGSDQRSEHPARPYSVCMYIYTIRQRTVVPIVLRLLSSLLVLLFYPSRMIPSRCHRVRGVVSR